jgi:hypothetical protein
VKQIVYIRDDAFSELAGVDRNMLELPNFRFVRSSLAPPIKIEPKVELPRQTPIPAVNMLDTNKIKDDLNTIMDRFKSNGASLLACMDIIRATMEKL